MKFVFHDLMSEIKKITPHNPRIAIGGKGWALLIDYKIPVVLNQFTNNFYFYKSFRTVMRKDKS